MPSKSYTTFQKNLNQVSRLIETYDHELERISKKGKKSLDHLTRAGLIFLCSSFEVYVESVTKETGKFITNKINQPKGLPMEVKKTISEAVKKEKNELSPILFYDDWKMYYNNLIVYDTRYLNTPKVKNIRQLFKNYFGIAENEIDDTIFPFKSLDDIVSERGAVAHNLYSAEYLKKNKLLEYTDTIKTCVLELDKLLYDKIPEITRLKPWNNTYV